MILQLVSPTLYRDEAYRRWHADALRIGASPASAYALNRAYAESDLSEVLPAVRVPTLVFYRQGGDAFDQEEEALDVWRICGRCGELTVGVCNCAASAQARRR